MGFLQRLKKSITKLDFFRTSQYLRYRSEPEFKSFFGGIVSLLLITGLIATFSTKLVDTVEKVIITSESSNINAADPKPFTISTYQQDNFMFGVQIWHHDLNTGKRFFDVVLSNPGFDSGESRNQTSTLMLEPCTLNHWSRFPQVQKDYDRLKMNYWLCLPKNMKYNIQGKYASVFSQTLQVSVNKCTNQSNPLRQCASQAQIDDYFQESGPLFFTIYFINPLINPTSEDYLTFYLQDNNYIIFTDKFGSEGILFKEEYSITTDESIWPFTDNRQDTGGLVSQFALKNPYQTAGNVYCVFSFYKSGNSQIIQRKYQKMDEVLSYIGGLFGTITVCLFFVRIYNQAAFQIRLGASLFQLKNQSEEKILKNYNFFRFITTGLYKFLVNVGLSPDWKSCKQYEQSNEEMAKQLDVLYLLKRVIFLEKAITSLLNEHQLKGIHLHQKLTLQQAKKNRKNFKAKKKLTQINKKRAQKSAQICPTNNLSIQEHESYEGSLNGQNYGLDDKNKQGKISRSIFHFKRQTRKRLKTIFKKQKPVFDDESSSIDTENSDSEQILNELQQLKKQAKKGDSVSKKIWLSFNSQVRKEISKILKLEQVSSGSDNDPEDEILDSGVQLYNFLPQVAPPPRVKLNKRKISQQHQIEKHLQISNRDENTEQTHVRFGPIIQQKIIYEPMTSPNEGKRYSNIVNTN